MLPMSLRDSAGFTAYSHYYFMNTMTGRSVYRVELKRMPYLNWSKSLIALTTGGTTVPIAITPFPHRCGSKRSP